MPDTFSAHDRWRPWLLGGLCALFVARPLFPSESAAFGGDGLPIVMLWLVLAVFWLLGAIGRREFHVRFGWIDAAVALLVGWHTVAAIWATTRATPRPAVNMLWEWVAFGLSFFLARQLIVTRREARAVVAVMVGLAVALAAHGLYQHYYELPKTRAAYHRDPDKVLEEAGLAFAPDSRERELFEARLESAEPIATFALSNSLAGYLAPWLVMSAGIGASTGLSRKQWPTWVVLLVCALPVAACLHLTGSITGHVAAAAGLLLLAVALCRERGVRIGWKLPTAVAALGAVLVGAALLVGGLRATFLSQASKSFVYRVQYWQATLGMIGDGPIVGCGPGNFQNAYTAYMLPEASEEVADPHNFLMEIWATAGTPAFLALLAMLGLFAYALFGNRRPQRRPSQKPTADIPAGPTDATAFVLGGAVCGFLLSIPVGQISVAPPGAIPVVLGLPLAAATMAMLVGWIYRGRLPALVPAIGVLVLLVNLLAAGGIGFPGVAGTLWLLMAVTLNTLDAAPSRALPRGAALAALVFGLAMAVACSTTGFSPALECRAKMQIARQEWLRAQELQRERQTQLAQRHLLSSEDHLREAAAADPRSAEPWKQLASQSFARWVETREPEAFDQFETSMKRALQLSPNSAAAWRMYGDWYWQAYVETGRRDQEMVGKAVSAYRQAVDRYPNSGHIRASLALALRAAGNKPEFEQQAVIALRLDRIARKAQHADKLLDDRVRDELRQGLGRNIPGAD